MKATRMPPLEPHQMDAAQRAAAAELIAGPRKAVRGPFIALLRSPALMARLQKVGEYLRFETPLPARLAEFATLIVARHWTQQFEWAVHVPLARKEGVADATIAAVADGRRPTVAAADELLVHDFVVELLQHHGLADATYAAALQQFGEAGVIDLVALVGYFATVSMVLNVARVPAEPGEVTPLEPLPA